MKLLFIGGTRFVGRHLVQGALQAGHEITLFHRGQTNPDLFPQVEHILGDRDTDLELLRNGSWEAVIDTCGYMPKQVRASAKILAGRVKQYIFISTIAVYADFSQPGLTEDSPLATMDVSDEDEFTMENYGPLKALCETAVEDVFGEAAFIPRPGLIVGPHDTTDRFTYWVRRGLENTPFVAPGPGDQRVQLIDARDLAAWIIDGLQRRLYGAYNTTGPAERLTFKGMLDACKHGTGAQSDPVWADAAFLLEREVEPWSDLPLWIADEDTQGMLEADCRKAIAAGLTFRPLADTVADIAGWDQERGLPPLKSGLSADREAALISQWQEQAG